jgi:acetyltransferase-like isoleucine patch superfamily enzyme
MPQSAFQNNVLHAAKRRLARPLVRLAGNILRRTARWHEICWSYSLKIPANVTVGRHSYGFTEKTFYQATGKEEIVIGKYCSIAEDVQFISGEHDLKRVSTFPLRHLLLSTPINTDPIYRGPIVVGNDVWIGRRSMILSNVKIGDGAVIAAGSVVTRDVEPYTVVGGVPAKAIKRRFTNSQIDALLNIRWWDWPDEKIISNIELFYCDIEIFIKTAEHELP